MIQGQELVTLVDIQRSRNGMLFETTVVRKVYDTMVAKGKLGNWRLKSQIDSIESKPDSTLTENVVEIIEVEEEEAVEITPLNPEPVSSLDELRAELTAKGIKFHHAHKEDKLRELLNK